MCDLSIRLFKVGDLVTINQAILHNPAGTLCYVYEEYTFDKRQHGVSIISARGTDLGGFSLEEQAQYLQLHSRSDFTYEFTTAMQLADDFRNGMFADVFCNYVQTPIT